MHATTRYGFTLIAAAALTVSLGASAWAQDGSEEPDCPEDFDTEPGCDMSLPDTSTSEDQPVEGAATAPVEPADGGEGTTTMTGPDTEGDGGAPEETPEGGSTAEETGENAETGGAVTGGAETAPTPEGDGEGENSMSEPDADPDSDPEGGADEASAENSDAEVTEADVQGDPNIVVAYEDGGRYYTEDDIPTFHVAEDGTIDWLTYSGFRRYHSECHVCHGPDGEGSTYAPAIKNSAVNMDYYDFYDVVVNGRKNGNSVMPSFGDNANVMCYLDDIYVYLKARGAGEVARGRPANKEPKSDMIREMENACMGG
ncbi:c-type cytochrome, methanol metabolism-related [Roseivivax sediminis]|uniref:C-type cytochrome, methanol metabolism-related n=2 Tax=Roseivivax sediminis TaxID=936889 RepID=A0A1I1TWJ8_9RHOB|nr:c-type cytochrome, methanol metabolism-related [Roseivivax sediminis]